MREESEYADRIRAFGVLHLCLCSYAFVDYRREFGKTMSVSIVIPAFNSGHYLTEAVDSALGQRCSAKEVIVVNDGSTDETRAIMVRYGSRIVHLHQPNQGVSEARNAGARVATGKWLMFLDADDKLAPSALTNLLAHADSELYGVVYGRVMEFEDGSKAMRERGGSNSAGLPPVPAAANFRRALIVTPGAALVRRELHQKVGGFAKPWQPTEDRDYWMKLGVYTGFRFCKEVVVYKRKHAAQSVQKKIQTLNWGLKVQLEYYDWLQDHGIESSFLGVTVSEIIDDTIRRTIDLRLPAALRLVLITLKEKRLSTSLSSRLQSIARHPSGILEAYVWSMHLGRRWRLGRIRDWSNQGKS